MGERQVNNHEVAEGTPNNELPASRINPTENLLMEQVMCVRGSVVIKEKPSKKYAINHLHSAQFTMCKNALATSVS